MKNMSLTGLDDDEEDHAGDENSEIPRVEHSSSSSSSSSLSLM